MSGHSELSYIVDASVSLGMSIKWVPLLLIDNFEVPPDLLTLVFVFPPPPPLQEWTILSHGTLIFNSAALEQHLTMPSLSHRNNRILSLCVNVISTFVF